MISRGLWRSRPSLVSGDHITPDETMTRSDEMSHRSGSASSARRIGLANASPTIEIAVDAVALDRVEQLVGVEVAARHRDDRAADHQVATSR